MFELETKGSWSKTIGWLERLLNGDFYDALDRFGQMGVDALASNTPVETGETASSWAYEVTRSGSSYRITWYNTHNDDGQNVAILLQYGHGTGTGGYVAGQDYINPAMRPVFDEILDALRKEVRL